MAGALASPGTSANDTDWFWVLLCPDFEKTHGELSKAFFLASLVGWLVPGVAVVRSASDSWDDLRRCPHGEVQVDQFNMGLDIL